jgi:hypothetical protein
MSGYVDDHTFQLTNAHFMDKSLYLFYFSKTVGMYPTCIDKESF